MNVPKIFATKNYTQKQGLKTRNAHKTNPLYQSGVDTVEFNSKNVSFGKANIKKELKEFLKSIPDLEEKLILCKLKDADLKDRGSLKKKLNDWYKKLFEVVITDEKLAFTKSYVEAKNTPGIAMIPFILKEINLPPQFHFINGILKKNPSILKNWVRSPQTISGGTWMLTGLAGAIDTQPKSEIALELLNGTVDKSYIFDEIKTIVSYVTDKNLELAKKLVNIRNQNPGCELILNPRFFRNVLTSESPAQQITKKIEGLSKQINILKSQLAEGIQEDVLNDKTTISVIEKVKEDLGKLL